MFFLVYAPCVFVHVLVNSWPYFVIKSQEQSEGNYAKGSELLKGYKTMWQTSIAFQIPNDVPTILHLGSASTWPQ